MIEKSSISKDVLELSARLQLNVGRLVRSIRTYGVSELTPSQMSALYTVSDSGPVRISEVAAREGISAPIATRIVASLEGLDLVNRVADPEDGRASLMEVSRTGSAILQDMHSARITGLAGEIANLTKNEIQLLERALPVIEKIIKERKLAR